MALQAHILVAVSDERQLWYERISHALAPIDPLLLHTTILDEIQFAYEREEIDLTLLDARLLAECSAVADLLLAKHTHIPVIVLQNEEDELIINVGATTADAITAYLTMPCDEMRLLAEVQTILHHRVRPNGDIHNGPLRFGSLLIDLEGQQVRRSRTHIHLSRMEWRLLAELVRHRGQVVTHRMLLRQVWGEQYGDEYEYLHTYIRRLRRKLEDNPTNPVYLLNEPKVGYRFVMSTSRGQGTGNREQEVGKREEGAEEREQGVGKREQGSEMFEQENTLGEQQTGSTVDKQETGSPTRDQAMGERQPDSIAWLETIGVVTHEHIEPFPTNLPTPTTSFVGRNHETAAILEALRREDVRLLSITGSGGIGKTRLALHIADLIQHACPHGVCYVDCATLTNHELVLSTIAHTLDIKESGDQALFDAIKTYLQPRRLLLLLDTFEPVIDAAPLLVDMLSAMPQLTILVTSRLVLRLSAEYEFPVPPLRLPDREESFALQEGTGKREAESGSVELQQGSGSGAQDTGRTESVVLLAALEQIPAIALFVARAQTSRSSFVLTAENAAAVAELCVRLDGLPLAIELAAARTRLLTPDALLQRLQKPLDLLTRGLRDAPARQQSLRATLQWSYDLLSPTEQCLFRYLGVFVGGCTLEAAEAVADTGEQASDSANTTTSTQSYVLDALTTLLEHSLLRQISDDEDRFFMLDTVREYAVELLETSGEADEARQRHSDYYFSVAERAESELKGSQQKSWFRQLEREHNNLRAALHWISSSGNAKAMLKMSTALWFFWFIQGYFSEGRQWLQKTLATRRVEQQESLLAKALYGLGVLALKQYDYEKAQSSLEESLSLFRRLADNVSTSMVLNNLGIIFRHKGDLTIAKSLLLETLRLQRDIDDKRGIISTLGNLGIIALDQGDLTQAHSFINQGLSISQDIEDLRLMAINIGNLGLITYYQGDFAVASGFFEQALSLKMELNDLLGIAINYSRIGYNAYRQGNNEQGRLSLIQGTRLLYQLNAKGYIIENLEFIAEITTIHEHRKSAIRLYGVAEELRKDISYPLPEYFFIDHQKKMNVLRETVDETTWITAWAEGESMNLDQAVRYAIHCLEELKAQINDE
jgi:predicted ATPase/DNA-binding response OmpR family regulator